MPAWVFSQFGLSISEAFRFRYSSNFLRPETRNTFTKGWSEAYPLAFKVIKQLYQNPVAVEIDGSSLLKPDGMDLPATFEDPSLTGNNDQ